MSMEVTNNAPNGLVIWEPVFDNETLTAAGALTYAAGTLLARKAVEDAVVAAADGGNAGDGTVTLATVAAGEVVPIVGAYNLECTLVVAEGGVFKLEDPNGTQVAGGITLTVGAGGTTVINVAGLTFTVTEGGTDFALGDKFSLTVAVDGDMVAYDRAGAGGAQIPSQVLTVAEVFAGAASQPVRPLISGRVRRADMIIHGVGTGILTDAEVDMLRDYDILAQETTQLAELDNQ